MLATSVSPFAASEVWLTAKKLSFFELTDFYFGASKTRRPFARACSLMRALGTRSILVENELEKRAYFATEYRAVAEEFRGLRSSDPTVSQITFFSLDSKKAEKALGKNDSSGIMGACIVIRPRKNKRLSPYLFEAVLQAPKTSYKGALNRNYYHIEAEPGITVRGNGYLIPTSYFCQQNGINSVCAHSALKMALWHATDDFQFSTNAINKRTKRNASNDAKRKAWRPSDGLHIQDIQAVCESVGVQTLVLDCSEKPGISPFEYAYLLIESRIPTIIVFSPDRSSTGINHVVPLIGHDINGDLWLPQAVDHYSGMPRRGLVGGERDYMSSVEYVPHLLIHDDIVGPYLSIGRTALHSDVLKDKDPGGRIEWVIGLVPQKGPALPGAPYNAQVYGARLFANLWHEQLNYVAGPWSKRLSESPFSQTNVVLRTLLVSRKEYAQHLEEIKDHYGVRANLSQAARRLLNQLDEYFWMIEFSLPSLYTANRSKLGELLLPLDIAALPDVSSGTKEVRAPFPLAFRFVNSMNGFRRGWFDLKFRSHTPLMKSAWR